MVSLNNLVRLCAFGFEFCKPPGSSFALFVDPSVSRCLEDKLIKCAASPPEGIISIGLASKSTTLFVKFSNLLKLLNGILSKLIMDDPSSILDDSI